MPIKNNPVPKPEQSESWESKTINPLQKMSNLKGKRIPGGVFSITIIALLIGIGLPFGAHHLYLSFIITPQPERPRIVDTDNPLPEEDDRAVLANIDISTDIVSLSKNGALVSQCRYELKKNKDALDIARKLESKVLIETYQNIINKNKKDLEFNTSQFVSELIDIINIYKEHPNSVMFQLSQAIYDAENNLSIKKVSILEQSVKILTSIPEAGNANLKNYIEHALENILI